MLKGNTFLRVSLCQRQERYNIAQLLDKQVVTQTLNWLAANPEALANLGMCSINLSGHSMGNKEFIAFYWILQFSTALYPVKKSVLKLLKRPR